MGNKFCTCHESEKHGQTSVMCCNACGLPDEDFWQQPHCDTSPKQGETLYDWEQVFDNAQTMHLQEFISHYKQSRIIEGL